MYVTSSFFSSALHSLALPSEHSIHASGYVFGKGGVVIGRLSRDTLVVAQQCPGYGISSHAQADRGALGAFLRVRLAGLAVELDAAKKLAFPAGADRHDCVTAHDSHSPDASRHQAL